MNVKVFGAEGFVGSAIMRAKHNLNYRELFKNLNLIPITRKDWDDTAVNGVRDYSEVVINAATPSGRFAAQQKPWADFKSTAETTFRLLTEVKTDHFVHISSVSARENSASIKAGAVYSINKSIAEKYVSTFRTNSSAVIRLGPMYGFGLKKA